MGNKTEDRLVVLNEVLYGLYCSHCDLYMNGHCTSMGSCQYPSKGEVTKAIEVINQYALDGALGSLPKWLIGDDRKIIARELTKRFGGKQCSLKSQ